MTARAEEIAAEEYPDTNGPDGETIYMEGQRQVFVKGYNRGQQDRWISVSQFEAPAPGTIMQAGDAMAVQLRHLAEEYRNTMSMRGGSSDIHPSHAEALTAWYATKSQPPLDIPEAIKAFEFIKEIGERKGTNNDRDIAMHMMVKWANHGIASLTHQPK